MALATSRCSRCAHAAPPDPRAPGLSSGEDLYNVVLVARVLLAAVWRGRRAAIADRERPGCLPPHDAADHQHRRRGRRPRYHPPPVPHAARGGGAVAWWAGGCATAAQVPPIPQQALRRGLARRRHRRGPRPRRPVLWTRVGAPTGRGLCRDLGVAADDAFGPIARRGVAVAEASANWTVKVPVTGLDPDSWFTGTASRRRMPADRAAPHRPPRCGDVLAPLRVRRRQQQGAPSRSPSEPREADLDFFLHLGDYVTVNDGEHDLAGRLPGRVPPVQGRRPAAAAQATVPWWRCGTTASSATASTDRGPARRLAAQPGSKEHARQAPGGDVAARTGRWRGATSPTCS